MRYSLFTFSLFHLFTPVAKLPNRSLLAIALSPFHLFTFSLFLACTSPQVPTSYKDSQSLPNIYPDYVDVTIPVNMAPLHFQLMPVSNQTEVITRFKCGDEELVCSGRKAMPSISDWQRLINNNDSLTVEVFEHKADGWVRYKPFNIYVSPDSIDSWLSYRLISPSYVAFEELTINQRCLENYDEGVIYNNMLCSSEKDGQCINCHSYQKGNPQRMQFHARLNNGGTLINYDGQLRKVNLKTDSTLSAGVYPAWHPTLPFIAYSTDITRQMFHTFDVNKVEVFDTQSDLILYDLERNEVLNVENSPVEFEVFPSWSPDGRWLYYCSAHFEQEDTVTLDAEIIRRYNQIRYNVYRKSFDPEHRTFGPSELVFDAASRQLSATLPRISPDGRWLMLSVGGWGCFHIWHSDADLWLIDLKEKGTVNSEEGLARRPEGESQFPTALDSSAAGSPVGNSKLYTLNSTLNGEARPWTEVNSPNTEAYHTWSSNGKWIVFSSRRDDGNFTRPFFAHVDASGRATKPFELPCDDPDRHRRLLKSYNIPELMRGPVTISPQTFADALKGDAQPATFVSREK